MSSRDLLTVTAETKLPPTESYDAITIEPEDYPGNWKDPYPQRGDPKPTDPFRATAKIVEQVLPHCRETFKLELPLYSIEDTGDHGLRVVNALLEHGTHLSALHVSTALPPATADLGPSDFASECFFRDAINKLLRELSDPQSPFRNLHTFSLHLVGDTRVPHWILTKIPQLCLAMTRLTGKEPKVSIYATQTLCLPGLGVIGSTDTRNNVPAVPPPQFDRDAAAAAGASAPSPV